MSADLVKHPVHCIVFARAPLPGRTKTRLAQFLGPERAARVYSVTLAAALRACSNFSFTVYAAEESDRESLERLLVQENLRASVCVQTGGPLGLRMADALAREALAYPQSVVCLIGSDIPRVTSRVIESAADQAADGLVLGPAKDGGYWLIGAQSLLLRSHNVASWFGLEWSRPDVFARQTQILQEAGLRVSSAATMSDIDEAPEFFAAALREKALGALRPNLCAILPVLNEEENLPFVLGPLRESGLFSSIVCVDNGSTDRSARVARREGAIVIESAKGYGNACLAGMNYIRNEGGCDAVLFIDADGSDQISDIWDVLAPVVSGRADFCLGRRVPVEAGALLPHARFGNWLSCTLMRIFWGGSYKDLGPLRALSWQALESLSMTDKNFGWTVEMQIRALKKRLRIIEIPVGYRRRMFGASKVSANLRGSILAGWVILRTVLRELLWGGHGG